MLNTEISRESFRKDWKCRKSIRMQLGRVALKIRSIE